MITKLMVNLTWGLKILYSYEIDAIWNLSSKKALLDKFSINF